MKRSTNRVFTCDAPTEAEPVIPPQKGAALTPGDIAAVKQLVKLVPAVVQLLNDAEPSPAEPTADNVAKRAEAPAPIGHDIYTSPDDEDPKTKGPKTLDSRRLPIGHDIFGAPDLPSRQAHPETGGQGLVFR